MLKKQRWLIVLILGGAMIFPMLGSFGLWDPIEIQQADLAQDVSKSGSFRDVTVGGRFAQRPVLYVWLVALGFKLLGVNELAGRLPLAVVGLLSLLIAFRVGRRLFSDGAGLAAALVLGTTPMFLFQCRQLESEVPFYASLLASVGGFAAFIWPVNARRCPWDLALGAVGLVAGFLSRGLLLGTVFPLASLALAVALSWRTSMPLAEGTAGEGACDRGPGGGSGEDAPAGPSSTTVGQSLAAGLRPLLLALVGAGVLIGIFLALLANTRYLLLGGEWRRLMEPPTFETTLRDLGWGFYPWVALLPLMLASFVLAQRQRAEDRSPDAFPKLLVLVLAAGGYVLASFWRAYLGDLHFPAMPWMALGVGVAGYQVLAGARPAHRFWAVAAVGMILALQQDFFMQPESIAFSHLTTQGTKYPLELNIKVPMRVFGILFSLLLFFALGGAPRQVSVAPATGFFGKIFGLLMGAVEAVGRVLRLVVGEEGRNARVATAALAVVFAGWCVFYLTPSLSLHLSNKALFGTFHKCRTGGEHLAQYQVPGRGAAYYNDGQVEDISDQNQLFALLRQDKRCFILVPSQQLAPIDQAARQQNVAYYVLDDRSSQYLIISNKLEGKCNADHNPLRRLVLSQEPKPRKVVKANFDNKAELLGYDLDDVVTRGGKFKITLYFKVTGRMPSGYKLFIHFDQPANRFHGDHEPLDGKYPTEYWLPGDYIVDPYEVDIPLFTTPSGSYTILMGFWLGESRIPVVEGPNDGQNRVNIGTLQVR